MLGEWEKGHYLPENSLCYWGDPISKVDTHREQIKPIIYTCIMYIQLCLLIHHLLYFTLYGSFHTYSSHNTSIQAPTSQRAPRTAGVIHNSHHVQRSHSCFIFMLPIVLPVRLGASTQTGKMSLIVTASLREDSACIASNTKSYRLLIRSASIVTTT